MISEKRMGKRGGKSWFVHRRVTANEKKIVIQIYLKSTSLFFKNYIITQIFGPKLTLIRYDELLVVGCQSLLHLQGVLPGFPR